MNKFRLLLVPTRAWKTAIKNITPITTFVMKIILLKQVQGLGQAGDIKVVSNGYARNFLIPQGLADLLTKHGLGVLEAQKKKQVRSKRQEVKSKKQEAKKINGKSFEIITKADEKGTLYAGLDKRAIANELESQGFKIEPNEVKLKEVIKKIGQHTVKLHLNNEKVIIKLDIVSN